MVNFSVDQIREMMDKPDNIRNISVIAHVDHGKSTLTDSLISKAGIIAAARSGDARFMDTRDDEQARAITIKSTAVSLFYEKENDLESIIRAELKKNGKSAEEIIKAFKALDKMPDADRAEFVKKYEAILTDTPTTPYLINLIDSPGHVDFSSEVTAALRVTDGALVVVDCVSGVSVQTETVLRQALAERIKPVLFLNKIDRQLLEHLIKEPEEAYQAYRNSVESANAVIATYRDETLGDVQVDPLNGTVGFGSGYHAWGFTLQRFANMYERMGKGKAKSLLKRMWGDQFQEYTVRIKQFHNGKPVFSSAEKVVGPELQKLFKKNKKHKPSWVKKDNMPKPVDGETDKELYRMSERGFCFLVYRPISDLAEAIITEDKDKYEPELKKWGIKLPPDAVDKSGKDLVKSAMRVWLPAGDTLLDMICTHLPSPREAQRYRLDNLYTGPLDDACANGIRNCDPKAPLMLYVSKMVPTSDKGRFFAFGRVFSGTVKTGQAARILTEDYVPGKTVVKPKKIQRTVLMMGRYTEQVADMPCGNVVGLVGVDQYILKTATLTTDDEGFPIKTMKFSVSPVVRVAVETTNASDLPKLVEGLKRLSKSDPLVQISTAKTGEHIIAGAGELHIQICIQDLRDDYLRGAGLRVSEPVVSYAESLQQTRSDYEDPVNPGKESCMGKSPNKHNRIKVWAEELGEKLTVAIDEKDISESQDFKERARMLKNDFDWHPDEARKIWTFGCLPDARCNLLVDMTKSVQYLHEIKDSCVGAFMQATAGGPMCDEVMRGCRFNIDDVTLHADSIHRGAGQIMPPMKRAVFAAMLKFQPALMEPIYLVEITSNMDMESKIYNLMSQNRGSVDSKDEKAAAPMIRMKCYLPVMESFGFNAKLLTACSGEAFSQLTFSHWQLMNGNPLEEGSSANKVMMAVRERKGLKAVAPKFEDYNDRL